MAPPRARCPGRLTPVPGGCQAEAVGTGPAKARHLPGPASPVPEWREERRVQGKRGKEGLEGKEGWGASAAEKGCGRGSGSAWGGGRGASQAELGPAGLGCALRVASSDSFFSRFFSSSGNFS